MVWNTPGKGGDSPDNNRRNPWPPRRPTGGGGGLGGLPERLREMFDGSGGGGIVRWVLLAIALLVVLTSFQLIGEQQRGVVLRFGQFARIMQPGPNLKWPWPTRIAIGSRSLELSSGSWPTSETV